MSRTRDIAGKAAPQRRGATDAVGATAAASGKPSRHARPSTPAPRPAITILDAIDDASIWRGWFRNPRTWAPWRAFLSVLFGLPLDAAGLELYRQCTERDDRPPATGFNEAWLCCGRRAGKSFVLALIAAFLAAFRDWSEYTVPGETPVIKIIAVDRRQARLIKKYCAALLSRIPASGSLIARQTDDEIILRNGIHIEVATASFRTTRGYTVIAVLLDEIAYLRTDDFSANPDSEIIAALRPAMATVRGAMFLAASSPYARRGELYRSYREHHGKPSNVLFWKAATRVMNPTVPASFIDDEMERDPARAAAEYLADFRSDIEGFVSREVVDDAVVLGRHELPHLAKTTYHAFVDPAGGSGGDSMTLAIAHRDGAGRAILDLIRERRPPFSPEQVAGEFAQTLRSYGVRRVAGDHYAGEWPREQFRKSGVQYEPSDRSKSEIYLESLPLLNSGRVELLDLPRLISQLCGLERRTARSGRDSIDHAPGAHDDVCNSALGALLLASAAKSSTLALSQPALSRLAQMPQRDRFSRSGAMTNFPSRQLGLR